MHFPDCRRREQPDPLRSVYRVAIDCVRDGGCPWVGNKKGAGEYLVSLGMLGFSVWTQSAAE